MKEYYIIIFKNTHDVINGEKFLKEKGVKVNVMPTPALITQSCGISIKIDSEYIDMVKKFVEQDQLVVKNIYRRNDRGYTQL
ncbi:DUF3343 domain-containing protein [Clostridium luticellarii]|jgi:hypothetical protein|uniref:Putative Se/S carrier protein-like domain-containing protein n=1 Tax=Clostridium luticellarii TaxID=1691940 RepID=A0A2T0B477_9CLOT|nr:DUF3343 domain-containing protein [Clostridium luticellarii]MCI1945861.1 DUF3343 domain-containing protein [Clostridium luticellarii]MCI1969193.1 DUF3343 domain-containing protein [Clostridium luticellarii]MCI1996163.1 DUF3343 domain-containing protein [Clostridium luticellarii]MCI2040504.1 DUF3343 domain-containing protein [Clostridium luticellarii]PRR78577.1 hypothetical protein CLLU_36300 [Clostridium luticellarii]